MKIRSISLAALVLAGVVTGTITPRPRRPRHQLRIKPGWKRVSKPTASS